MELVRECIAAARAFNPDVVLGLGGGSNMDPAKLVAAGPGPRRRPARLRRRLPRARPGDAADLRADHGRHRLRGLGRGRVHRHREPDQGVVPQPVPAARVAVVDPLLTVCCPPKVTADSGIDALTHAIEAFTAVDNDDFPLPSGEKSVYQGKNPMADAMAREGDHARRQVPAAGGEGRQRPRSPRRHGPGRDARRAGVLERRRRAGSRDGVPGRRGGPRLARGRQRPAAAVRDAVQPAEAATRRSARSAGCSAAARLGQIDERRAE